MAPEEEIDALLTARLLVKRHGLLAADWALNELRDACAAGDIDGCVAWSRILAAINSAFRNQAASRWFWQGRTN